ncbi:deoxyribonuclease IV [Desulfosarcina sp. BuS5]|uniref:deoxyribonuclease IV n=1 Tax=Desulfosarcina sp. BuS5 TaxID=933262 RepID=UPI00055435B2|nr:deoxyribonuclease IV [Desulfosarcina sp. BuS5]WDN90867.1 deoxyribonuclease IV [Desulfosarcina sp. BuS5]
MNIIVPKSILGAHLSIAKGLHTAIYEAEKLNCNALQIFTKNAATWKEKRVTPDDIDLFKLAMTETGIKQIASHTSYLINLAATDKKKHAMSRKALQDELIRSSFLGIPYVVLHPGSHMGSGEQKGIEQISDSINEIFSGIPDLNTRLLLETTAGQGSGIGHSFEQIASILEKIENINKAGVCLDTCHIFAAGYDIRTGEVYNETIKIFDEIIGLQQLYLMHLNDSKKELGSRVDRHEQIGKGFIGLKAFELIMNDNRLRNIPKIIETPKGKEGNKMDRINLDTLVGLIYERPL